MSIAISIEHFYSNLEVQSSNLSHLKITNLPPELMEIVSKFLTVPALKELSTVGNKFFNARFSNVLTMELLGREDHRLAKATFAKYLKLVHEKIPTISFSKINGVLNILSSDQSNSMIFFPNLRNLNMDKDWFDHKFIQMHKGLQALRIGYINVADIAHLPASLQSLEITLGLKDYDSNWIDKLPKTLTELSCPLESLLDSKSESGFVDFKQFPPALEKLKITCLSYLEKTCFFKRRLGDLPDSLKSLSVSIFTKVIVAHVFERDHFVLPPNLVSLTYYSNSWIIDKHILALPQSLRHLDLLNNCVWMVCLENLPKNLLTLTLPNFSNEITIEDLNKLPSTLRVLKNLKLPLSLLDRVPEIFNILPKQLSEIEIMASEDTDRIEEIHICKYLNPLLANITKLSMNFIAARVDWKEIVWPVNLTDLTITGYVSQEKEEEAIFISQLPHLTNLVISGNFNPKSLAAVLPKTIESVWLSSYMPTVHGYTSTVLDYGRIIMPA